MTNTQFGFVGSLSSPHPAGASVDFIVPTGIDTLSTKSGSGGWCSGGNLYLSGVYLGGSPFVECGITYVNSIPKGPPSGWYFWYGNPSNIGNTPPGIWSALSVSPVNHHVTLKITWSGSQYQASLTDHDNSSNNKLVGYGVGTPSQFTVNAVWMFFENGGDLTCSDYSNYYGGQDFKNLTYYDSSGNVIAYTPTGSQYIQNTDSCSFPSNLTFG